MRSHSVWMVLDSSVILGYSTCSESHGYSHSHLSSKPSAPVEDNVHVSLSGRQQRNNDSTSLNETNMENYKYHIIRYCEVLKFTDLHKSSVPHSLHLPTAELWHFWTRTNPRMTHQSTHKSLPVRENISRLSTSS